MEEVLGSKIQFRYNHQLFYFNLSELFLPTDMLETLGMIAHHPWTVHNINHKVLFELAGEKNVLVGEDVDKILSQLLCFDFNALPPSDMKSSLIAIKEWTTSTICSKKYHATRAIHSIVKDHFVKVPKSLQCFFGYYGADARTYSAHVYMNFFNPMTPNIWEFAFLCMSRGYSSAPNNEAMLKDNEVIINDNISNNRTWKYYSLCVETYHHMISFSNYIHNKGVVTVSDKRTNSTTKKRYRDQFYSLKEFYNYFIEHSGCFEAKNNPILSRLWKHFLWRFVVRSRETFPVAIIEIAPK